MCCFFTCAVIGVILKFMPIVRGLRSPGSATENSCHSSDRLEVTGCSILDAKHCNRSSAPFNQIGEIFCFHYHGI